MNKAPEVKQTLEKNRKNALKKLIDGMNAEKLSLLKVFLDNSSIKYDSGITDYYKLIDSLKKTLDKKTKKDVLDKCNEIDNSCQNLINNLSKGSENAFDEFMKKVFNIVKPISVGLAINTAVQLAPTPITKLIPMGIGVLYGGYKLCKNNQIKKVINKEEKLNLKIQSRELKYDEKNNLIDTRFSLEEQNLIRSKLKEMKVEFKDFGYQSLRSVVYGLPYEQKIQLVMYLEGRTNRAEFLKELKKYNSIPGIEKRRFVPVTTALTAKTLEQMGLLNIIQTTGLVALNGMLATKLTKNLTGSNILGTLSGLLTSGATLTNMNSPIIQAETVLISIIIAEIIRVFAKTVRSIKNGIHNKKISKKFLEIEKEKYKDYDNIEKNLVQEYMNSDEVSKYIGESIIVSLITNYVKNNLNVDIKTSPKNINQLSLIINGLKPAQKRKIHSLLEELKYFNKNPNNQIIHKIEKMLKTTGLVAMFGLAGLSVVDIFTKGEFLAGISEKLFFTDAPAPVIIETQHTKTVTNDPSAGLIRTNENGEHVMETTYEIAEQGAFNTRCNYYYDQKWLMDDTGMTVEEYLGNHPIKIYEADKDVAELLLKSPNFSDSDKIQLNKYLEFLQQMIKKRQEVKTLGKKGTYISISAAAAGAIGSGNADEKNDGTKKPPYTRK